MLKLVVFMVVNMFFGGGVVVVKNFIFWFRLGLLFFGVLSSVDMMMGVLYRWVICFLVISVYIVFGWI